MGIYRLYLIFLYLIRNHGMNLSLTFKSMIRLLYCVVVLKIKVKISHSTGEIVKFCVVFSLVSGHQKLSECECPFCGCGWLGRNVTLLFTMILKCNINFSNLSSIHPQHHYYNLLISVKTSKLLISIYQSCFSPILI